MEGTGESFIALSLPHMHADAMASMEDAFRTNWIAQVGATVDAFERELAARVGVPSAFATHSGTDAIHLALALCDVGPGDTVFCASLTFIASANPVLYRGAVPVFIDSEPGSWGMSPRALERALEDARRRGKPPKAIVVVNLYGQSADLDALVAIAARHGVPVIEDAAESLGATYKGRASGTIGRLGVYSFAGNKIITTSTGGMLVSPDAALIARARHIGVHHARDKAHVTDHVELGFNYRLSNVLAGIGRSQLRVLDERVDARRAVYARYEAALGGQPGVAFMPEASYGRANRWLSVVLIDRDGAPSPTGLVERFAAARIEVRRVFKPLHLQPLFAGSAFYADVEGAEPVCERIYRQGLCLPSSSSLSVSDQERVIETLARLVGLHSRRAPRRAGPIVATAPAVALASAPASGTAAAVALAVTPAPKPAS